MGWDEVGGMQAPQPAGLGGGSKDTSGMPGMNEFAQVPGHLAGSCLGLWLQVQWSFRKAGPAPGPGSSAPHPPTSLTPAAPSFQWQRLSAQPGPASLTSLFRGST